MAAGQGTSCPISPREGYLFLDRAKFPASFAADVDRAKAEFMADAQVTWAGEALEGAIGLPAWKAKPSCIWLRRMTG